MGNYTVSAVTKKERKKEKFQGHVTFDTPVLINE